MTQITEAVKSILADDRCEISAELTNQLHACNEDHPWGRGRSSAERKLDALFAVAQAKYVPVTLLRNLERSRA